MAQRDVCLCVHMFCSHVLYMFARFFFLVRHCLLAFVLVLVLPVDKTDCMQVSQECFQGHMLGEDVCSVLICSDLADL